MLTATATTHKVNSSREPVLAICHSIQGKTLRPPSSINATKLPTASKVLPKVVQMLAPLPAEAPTKAGSITSASTMQEIKIENFYSAVGINMENIYSNDKVVTAKLNELSEQGWELTFINTGVQSPTDGGKAGIYCTRYILRRAK